LSDVSNDLDEMTRRATRLADAGDWDRLLTLRDDCRAAVERGLQLWPVASYCEYRLALDAPGAWAAEMLVAGTGHFALGPLTEVVAVNHTWSDLAPHAPRGPLAALAAHERVVRGEDLREGDVAEAAVLEVPMTLESWEPAYPVALYKNDGATFPGPPLTRLSRAAVSGAPIGDAEAEDALTQLGAVWATESNGRAAALTIERDALASLTAIDAAAAFAHMAWAAASGGAHGRRRGMAPGRFAAWWAAVAVAGELDAWPLPSGAMEALVTDRLRWYSWTDETSTGWTLRLAIEDTERGVAYAVTASDWT